MSSFYEFASNSPFLTFFLFLIVGSAIESVFKSIFKREKCACQAPKKKVKPVLSK
jgi:hypothetical protein